MSTSQRKVDIFLKKFLPQQQITENFFDYLESKIHESLYWIVRRQGVFTPNTNITPILSSSAPGTINFFTPLVGTDGPGGHILSLDPLQAAAVPFQNSVGIIYHTGIRFNRLPRETEINVRTGKIKYSFLEESIGELAEPDLIVDNLDGTLTVTVDSVAEVGVSNAGRKVIIWLKDAVNQAQAFEEATVVFTGGANKINTTTALGQILGSISVDTTKYQVFLKGPTIRRNTDLSLDPSIVYTGAVTGNGGTPTVFNHSQVNNLSNLAEVGSIISVAKAFLTRGGLITWDLTTQTLTWAADLKVRMTTKPYGFIVAAGSQATIADQDVLYIQLDLIGGVKPIIKVVSGGVPNDALAFPIAMRDGNDIYFANGALELKGDSTPTQGTINDITQDLLDFMGAANESDADPDYQASDGPSTPNTIVTQGVSLTRGIKQLDKRPDVVARVKYVDLVAAVLPAGVAYSPDGTPVVDNDTVLFANPTLNGVYRVTGVGVALVWTKLHIFSGAQVPVAGISMVKIQSGTIYAAAPWVYTSSGVWRPFDFTEATLEPTGMVDRTQSTIAFNNGLRQLSITPVGGFFDYFIKGKLHRKNAVQTAIIPDVEGTYYFYFDGDTLSFTTVFDLAFFREKALVAMVYWDAANNVAIMVGDDRHGVAMDSKTKEFLHSVFGAQIKTGGLASGYTEVGDGSANAHAQLAIANLTLVDADLDVQVVDAAVPANPFEQILSPAAQIPVYYRSGASGLWRKDAATPFPVKQGAARITWNDPAGPWTTPDVADAGFMSMWLLATNNISEPVIAILGQAEWVTQAEAESTDLFASLDLTGLPIQNFKVLYQLIFETQTAFANTPNAALRVLRDLRKQSDSATAVGGGSVTPTAEAESSSGGGELTSLNFRARIEDPFNAAIDGTTPTDNGAGKTDAALYSLTNKLFRLAYDATKTATGTGLVNYILSGAPSFTVKAGDMLVVGGYGRRITNVNSQTDVDIESAFPVDPAASACLVSQAWHSVDLNNFDNDGLGLSVFSRIPDNINEALVVYQDSETLDDVIPDYGVVPHVAFDISANGVAFTGVKTRQEELSDEEQVVNPPVAGTNFYIRMFANKSAGSGFVNLLKVEAYWHVEADQVQGHVKNEAYCLTDGSGTQVDVASLSVVGGKTRLKMNFSYPRGAHTGKATGALWVELDGKQIYRIADAGQAYFTEIDDQTIELDQDYSGYTLTLVAKVFENVVDISDDNTSKISDVQDFGKAGFDSFIDDTTVLEPINGVPSASQFRSNIQNRKSIADFTKNLTAKFGIERIMTPDFSEIPGEFGINGERVFGIMNDDKHMIRLFGTWTLQTSTSGIRPIVANPSSGSVEIVFYGTGLNLLSLFDAAVTGFTMSVDGGVASDISARKVGSAVLNGRSYNSNVIIPIVSGLTLGVHTVVLSKSGVDGNLDVFGFEILNEAATIKVSPGTGFARELLKKIVASVETSAAFASDFNLITKEGATVGSIGTRGARVLMYLDSDGTVKKRAYATNAAQGILGAADHTHEQILRKYNFREFGSNRSDDFSFFTGGNFNLSFTLEDGITNLVGDSVAQYISPSGKDMLTTNGGVGTGCLFTFVGTGLDVVSDQTSTPGTVDVYVDGTLVGTITQTTGLKTVKVVSGLQYGTHVVKFFRNGAQFNFSDFIVYGPKKPAIPSNAIEISEYYLMANFVANAIAGLDTISKGVLRKNCTRENSYVGPGWNVTQSVTVFPGGFDVRSSGIGIYFEHTFYGTGFDIRFEANSAYSASNTVSLNGTVLTSANFPTANFSAYGGAVSFAPLTGVLSQFNGISINGAGLSVSNLPLGKYTIRVLNNTANFLHVETIDITTPIHVGKSNTNEIQNTLPVGNCALSDIRSLSPVKLLKTRKFRGEALAVVSSPSTSASVLVPMPDMHMTVIAPPGGAWFELTLQESYRNSSATAPQYRFYVDGQAIGFQTSQSSLIAAANDEALTLQALVFLSEGAHRVNAYWTCSGGVTSFGRRMKVLEQ